MFNARKSLAARLRAVADVFDPPLPRAESFAELDPVVTVTGVQVTGVQVAADDPWWGDGWPLAASPSNTTQMTTPALRLVK